MRQTSTAAVRVVPNARTGTAVCAPPIARAGIAQTASASNARRRPTARLLPPVTRPRARAACAVTRTLPWTHPAGPAAACSAMGRARVWAATAPRSAPGRTLPARPGPVPPACAVSRTRPWTRPAGAAAACSAMGRARVWAATRLRSARLLLPVTRLPVPTVCAGLSPRWWTPRAGAACIATGRGPAWAATRLRNARGRTLPARQGRATTARAVSRTRWWTPRAGAACIAMGRAVAWPATAPRSALR
jgi:hypothetical protein